MLNRQTRKLYYEDCYLVGCTAKIIRVGGDYLELDQTVAYPEGGGQEADHGVIYLDGGLALRFVDAKKMYGMPARLPDFPDVQVGGVIWHLIAPEDQPLMSHVREGQEVYVRIDAMRRAWLALSHTASHLLYLGVGAHRPDAVGATLGCHIKTDGARFDFSVESRFLPEELTAITHTANELVQRGLPVEVLSDQAHPDARYWRCDGRTIPCGGMHLPNTATVGALRVRRKSLGTGKERLSCDFTRATIDLAPYTSSGSEERLA